MKTFKTYSDLLNQFPNAQYNDIDFNHSKGLWEYKKQQGTTELILLTMGTIALILISFTIYSS